MIPRRRFLLLYGLLCFTVPAMGVVEKFRLGKGKLLKDGSILLQEHQEVTFQFELVKGRLADPRWLPSPPVILLERQVNFRMAPKEDAATGAVLDVDPCELIIVGGGLGKNKVAVQCTYLSAGSNKPKTIRVIERHTFAEHVQNVRISDIHLTTE